MLKYVFLFSLAAITTSVFSQKQGIKGRVEWISGNQMPSPDKTTTKSTGVSREISIYFVTTLEQTTSQDGVFFSNLETALVKKVKSKKNGSFCVTLPPGEYSVFVKEPRGLYANSFDSKSRIQYIQVNSGKYSTVTLLVNYEAAY